MRSVDVDGSRAPSLGETSCGGAFAVAATLVREREAAGLAGHPVGGGQGDTGQGAGGKEEEEDETRHCD